MTTPDAVREAFRTFKRHLDELADEYLDLVALIERTYDVPTEPVIPDHDFDVLQQTDEHWVLVEALPNDAKWPLLGGVFRCMDRDGNVRPMQAVGQWLATRNDGMPGRGFTFTPVTAVDVPDEEAHTFLIGDDGISQHSVVHMTESETAALAPGEHVGFDSLPDLIVDDDPGPVAPVAPVAPAAPDPAPELGSRDDA